MRTAGVADLKAHLTAYLRQIEAGQEILVTDRGVVVAKLSPVSAAERPGTRRERLARRGILRLGKGQARPSLLQPPPGNQTEGEGVLKALLAERQEGRR